MATKTITGALSRHEIYKAHGASNVFLTTALTSEHVHAEDHTKCSQLYMFNGSSGSIDLLVQHIITKFIKQVG